MYSVMQDANWQLTAKGKRKPPCSEQGFSLTLEEFAVHGWIDSEISRVSVSNLCAADCCPSHYRESYERFRAFVVKAGSADLATLLFPVFRHVFLRLLECNLPHRAEVFFLECMGDHVADQHRELSDLVALVQDGGIGQSGGAATASDACRFEVNLGPASLDKLRGFIEKSGDLFLLNFLRQYVSLDGIDLCRAFQSGRGRDQTAKSTASAGPTCLSGALANGLVTCKTVPAVIEECCTAVPDGSRDHCPAETDCVAQSQCKRGAKLLRNGLYEELANGALVNGVEERPEMTARDLITKCPKLPNGLQHSAGRGRLLQVISKFACSSTIAEKVPSLCLYSVSDLEDGVGTISASRRRDVVSAGCDNASLYVWKIPTGKGRHEASKDEDGECIVERSADEEVVLRGHGGPVYGCSFSPDDRFLVSCGADQTVRLWDVAGREEISCAASGHDSPIWDVAFSDSELMFASASHDATAKVWVVDNRGGLEQVRMLAGHLSDVDCVRFHPNSAYVATGSSDRSVRLWDVCSGRMVRLLVGSCSAVRCVAFSPCGRYLASAGDDSCVRIFELGSGQRVCELNGHTDVVYALAFSTSGDVLVSGGLDRQICVWNVNEAYQKDPSTAALPRSAFDDSAALSSPTHQLGWFSAKKTVPQSFAFLDQNVLFAFGASTNS